MLFRKVKDKRAKRALANGNEEAPPYQHIRNDKHVSVHQKSIRFEKEFLKWASLLLNNGC